MAQIVLIDQERCTGCGNCVNLCPRGILYLDDDGKCQVTDERQCDKLAGCQRVCPARAIRINRAASPVTA